MTAELFEQLIYNNTFDGRYRDGIKTKVNVADILDYASIKEKFEEIDAAIRAE